MEFEFYKLRVCGNDQILVNFLETTPPDPAVLAPLSRRLCDRVRGAGGSGVIYLLSRVEGRFHIKHYLPTGEESSIFPDTLVCACRYLFDSGYSRPDLVPFIESGHERDVRVVDSNHFTVNMGEPALFDGTPVREGGNREYTRNLEVGGRTVVATPLVLVRPAAAIFLGDERTGSLRNLSQMLSKSLEDAQRVQPVFIRVYDRDDLRIHLYFNRREKDYLSGAGSAAVAAVMNGLCDRQIMARAGRNDLYIRWNEKTNEVSVTAAAFYSFSGYFYYEQPAAGR